MSDQGTPVPDDEKPAQEHMHEEFKKLEETIEKDQADSTQDISGEAFGRTNT